MKIFISGTRGYIARELCAYINAKGGHEACLFDLRSPDWDKTSFNGVDCIVHAAALVHQNERRHSTEEYERVNVRLTEKLARKAKEDGVPHFVFLSSAAVYGVKPSLWKDRLIGRNSPCRPRSRYGLSKYKAELALEGFRDKGFALTILRPPMVYGKGCPGNYNSLRRLTLAFGLCPKIENQKSLVYISNLCECIALICEKKIEGTYVPQNQKPVKTYELASLIAQNNGKKLLCVKALNLPVKLLSLFIPKLSKAFGSETYSPALSELPGLSYRVCDWEASVRAAEAK